MERASTEILKIKHPIKSPILPKGTSDFAEMRDTSDGAAPTIADKTKFLPELLKSQDKVLVFTRPIRFGKSSVLSMLKAFLSIQDRENNCRLFDGLDISNDIHAAFRAKYQGQFPVIHLTLENIHANNWLDAKEELIHIIKEPYKKHQYVYSSLEHEEQDHYQRMMHGKGSEVELKRSLADLATYLSAYHEKKVIILIDEYDTPIHNAYKNTNKNELDKDGSYFKMMNEFMIPFFKQALKSHKGVEKGFMTGVLRTAFSGLLSSLNNTSVYSVLSPEFAEVFGFTEDEVENFISQIEGISASELAAIRKSMRDWYNGYHIGQSTVRMYNPWSVARFFYRLHATGIFAASAYWLQVGNSLEIYEHMQVRFEDIKTQLEDLMMGKAIQVKISERTTLPDLDNMHDDSAFWGLLLHAGYLSAAQTKLDWNNVYTCLVTIPNYEVRGAYANFINNYQKHLLAKSDPKLKNYNSMLQALLSSDIDKFAEHLQTYMEQVASFYDIPKQAKDKIPEQVYHAFFLGLLEGLHGESFQISSNREAGLGRYDIALIPKKPNQSGIIFEFKSTGKPSNIAKEANNALGQIKEKHYAAELKKNGAASGIYIGVGFCGKISHIVHAFEKYSTNKEFDLAHAD